MLFVKPPEFCFTDIAIAVARYHGIESRQLRTRKRTRVAARRRWLAIYLARELTPLSLPQIGERLHQDHTTILNGQRRAAALIQEDPKFAQEVEAVRAILASSTPFRKIIYARTADMRAASMPAAIAAPATGDAS